MIKQALAALTLGAASFSLLQAVPAVAAPSASLSPSSVTVTNDLPRETFLDLSVSDVNSSFLILIEAMSATVDITPAAGSSGDPWTISSIVLGSYFGPDLSGDPVGFGGTGQSVSIAFPAFIDEFGANLPWPDSGTIARIGISAPQGAALGSWVVSASVLLEGVNTDLEDDADSFTSSTAQLNITLIPEPQTYALLAAGLLFVAGVAARRRA